MGTGFMEVYGIYLFALYVVGIIFLAWVAFFIDSHPEHFTDMTEDDVHLISILTIMWPITVLLSFLLYFPPFLLKKIYKASRKSIKRFKYFKHNHLTFK